MGAGASTGGAAGWDFAPPTRVDTESSLPSRMTLPQPKPEPGARVTADLASPFSGDVDLSMVRIEPFLVRVVDAGEASEAKGEPFSEVGVARESWDLLEKCCSSLGRFRESLRTNDGK